MPLTVLPSPLPQRHVTTEAGIGGRLKERPEDFLVEEIPLYAPAGEGEHLYLGVQKTGMSHAELVSVLARHFNVHRGAIGYAGMKDKRAVTRQTMSVHLPGKEPASLEPAHDRVTILWAERHRNKLRRGHLVGNRFSIRIRGVEPVVAPRVLSVLKRLEREGLPGWYGEQRFGYRLNNHALGLMLLKRDWDGICDELLGSGGTRFPEYQRERRVAYDEGRHADAASAWTRADRAELIVTRALARGETRERAVRAIGAITLGFWASSFSSAVYNRVLDERVDAGTLADLEEGDVAWVHDRRACFAVTAQELADPALRERLGAFELSPTGPLWGSEMMEASAAVGERERAALATIGGDPDLVTGSSHATEGKRRPLRDRLEHADVEGGFDEHGPYVRCVFDLRRGMYATIALREVMKPGTGEPDEELTTLDDETE